MYDDLALVELVHRLMAEVAAEDLDLPHIVIRTDATRYGATYFGPFATALAALAAADAHECAEQEAPPRLRGRYHVAPLQRVIEQPA